MTVAAARAVPAARGARRVRSTTPSAPRPCPVCKAPVEWGPAAPFRPFCSERCKSLDFGAWASERYRIASRETGAGTPDPDDDGPA